MDANTDISLHLDGYLDWNGHCANSAGLKTLFKRAVMPHLVREATQDADFLPAVHTDKLSYIRNWLASSINNSAPWIYGELSPTSIEAPWLDRFKSLDALFNAAVEDVKEMNEIARRVYATYYDIGDITVHRAWPREGYRFVRIKTPMALRREGALMRNCMLHGEYDDVINQHARNVYSLRDRNNKPHVSIDAKDGVLLQCRGINNELPSLKYFRYIREFAHKKRFGLSENTGSTGMVFWDGTYHSIQDLPAGVEIFGMLDLTKVKKPLVLPHSTVSDFLSINASGPAIDYSRCKVEHVVRLYMDKDGKRHRDDGPAEIRIEKKTGRIIESLWYRHGEAIKAPNKVTLFPSCTEVVVRARGRNPSLA